MEIWFFPVIAAVWPWSLICIVFCYFHLKSILSWQFHIDACKLISFFSYILSLLPPTCSRHHLSMLLGQLLANEWSIVLWNGMFKLSCFMHSSIFWNHARKFLGFGFSFNVAYSGYWETSLWWKLGVLWIQVLKLLVSLQCGLLIAVGVYG